MNEVRLHLNEVNEIEYTRLVQVKQSFTSDKRIQ
jgi:hypothetical protein